jgi:hypothetical protein
MTDGPARVEIPREARRQVSSPANSNPKSK